MPPLLLSNYALSRRGYYADFWTVPFATSIAVIWLFSLHTVTAEVFASAILAGLIAWTFIEYVVHRWGFHGFMSKEHRLHHIHPNDFIGFSPVGTAIIGAMSFWALTYALGPVIGVGLLVGLVIGYFSYIAVHDRMHHGHFARDSFLAKLNAAHEYHHRRFKVNFGVTSPFWDIVFGTYQKPPK